MHSSPYIAKGNELQCAMDAFVCLHSVYIDIAYIICLAYCINVTIRFELFVSLY